MKLITFVTCFGILSSMSILVSCKGGGKSAMSKADSVNALITELQRGVKSNPDSIAIRYKLLDALANAERYKEAMSQTDSLIAMDSSNAVFWYKRGVLEEKTGDTVAAIHNLRASIARAPMFLEPMLELTYLLANQENAEALTWADAIITHEESPEAVARARFIKGVYYSNINDKEKALAAFDDCIRHNYTFMDAYIEKAILLFDEKKYDDALKTVQKANLVSNSFPDAYYWMGKCYEAMGNKELAIDNYKKTLGLDPDFKEAREALDRIK